MERPGPRAVLTVFATEDHDPARVGEARAAVRSWLADHDVDDDVSDRVLLVVSELVTNALRCTFGRTHVALCHLGGGTLVEVFDESPLRPSVLDAPPDATSGRGIAIVEAVSDRWGVRPDGLELGKVVWAVISPC
jgi:anti-sigma regulatory factor (Ser/Thr protein kinase)